MIDRQLPGYLFSGSGTPGLQGPSPKKILMYTATVDQLRQRVGWLLVVILVAESAHQVVVLTFEDLDGDH